MLGSLLMLTTATLLFFGSPGPAPIALFSSGAQHGSRLSRRFLCGIICGLIAASMLINFGFLTWIGRYPEYAIALKYVCAAYLAFLAYRLVFKPLVQGQTSMLPKFKEGFLLNLVNPKAYASLLAIYTQFSLPLNSRTLSLVLTGAICISLVLAVDFMWLKVGERISSFSENTFIYQALCLGCALLLLTFAILILQQPESEFLALIAYQHPS